MNCLSLKWLSDRISYKAAFLSTLMSMSSLNLALAACLQSDLSGKWAAFGLASGLSTSNTAGNCMLDIGASGGLLPTTSCTYRDAVTGAFVTIHPTGAVRQTALGACTFQGNVNTNVNARVAAVQLAIAVNKTGFAGSGTVAARPSLFERGVGFTFTAIKQPP